jgi:hypothetical protein
MMNCPQNNTQTIYQHGLSVQAHLKQLVDHIQDGTSLSNWRIPSWFFKYKEYIKKNLLPTDILLEYALFHDCGKPFCLTTDENGRNHFANHAQISAATWKENGGCDQIGRLIAMDMDIHTLKSEQVEEFCKRPECCSLLLSGLAEIHANAEMFGGIESTSFKIKWKQIDRRGNQIFNEINR